MAGHNGAGYREVTVETCPSNLTSALLQAIFSEPVDYKDTWHSTYIRSFHHNHSMTLFHSTQTFFNKPFKQ